MLLSERTVTSVSMTMNINNNPTYPYVGCAGKHSAQSFGSAAQIAKKEISNKVVSSVLKKFSEFSSPEQRLMLGVTALFTQPFIDLNNKRVNEDTRLMSFSRTLAKIIVGTTVGVLVRKECIKFAHKYTKMISIDKVAGVGKYAVAAEKDSILSPKYVRTYNPIYHDNYVNAIGTFAGIGVSLVTNFLIDAPLTQIFTNKCYKYLKNKGEENSQPEKSTNLLQFALSNNKKQVSFSGGAVNRLASNVIQEGANVNFRGFEDLKAKIWRNVVNNPGDTLMHTGAIGWAASSAAQITGMLFNDKIDSNKKKFLIPQEFADAVGNIALYYIVTVSIKNSVEKLFEQGKIRFKDVMEQFRTDKAKNLIKCEIEDLFKSKKVIEKLGEAIESKKIYSAHKNGASVLATLIASVISCNILTPYFRNMYGAYCYDKLKERSAKVNAKLFDMKYDDIKQESYLKKPNAFNPFIV